MKIVKSKKLIRDKLPDKYNLEKKTCPVNEYPTFLGLKLIEESKEVCKEIPPADEEVNKVKLIEELADVLEVFECISKFYNISLNEIKDIQNAKRTLNGGFIEGYIYEEVEDVGELE